MASARIQWWALTLASYEYTIKYKSGAANSIADALSHLPLPVTFSEVPVSSELVLLMEHMSSGPLTKADVKTMTQQDPVLSRDHSYVLLGWQETVDSSFNPYSSSRHELSVCKGCILWGNCVIPNAGHQTILDELHDSHQGTCHMKERTRMAVWWPLMNKHIETIASSCVNVKLLGIYLQWHPCTRCLFQTDHGIDCIRTMQVPWIITCY